LRSERCSRRDLPYHYRIMKKTPLAATVQALLAPGKGLLAADESFPTIGKRFDEYAIPSTEENRRAYRELLFTTRGLGDFISGAILFDETMRQRTADGRTMPEALAKRGIVPGIKVDAGAVALAGFPGEKFTQGLDGLRERLNEYRALGARFTKWRAVIAIGPRLPSPACLATNARLLALFASLSQEAGLVPIVEPEGLMDGNHSLDRCEAVTTAALEAVFAALADQRVVLEDMLLKSGMVLSGEACPRPADVFAVAAATIRCFRRAVPAAVPGIVFLSGGQSEAIATRRLRAICQQGPLPWKLTFSFGRALQDGALKAWRGSPARAAAGQAALHLRAKANGLAVRA
jgi:fructose-bisphosphate aldolase class I